MPAATRAVNMSPTKASTMPTKQRVVLSYADATPERRKALRDVFYCDPNYEPESPGQFDINKLKRADLARALDILEREPQGARRQPQGKLRRIRHSGALDPNITTPSVADNGDAMEVDHVQESEDPIIRKRSQDGVHLDDYEALTPRAGSIELDSVPQARADTVEADGGVDEQDQSSASTLKGVTSDERTRGNADPVTPDRAEHIEAPESDSEDEETKLCNGLLQRLRSKNATIKSLSESFDQAMAELAAVRERRVDSHAREMEALGQQIEQKDEQIEQKDEVIRKLQADLAAAERELREYEEIGEKTRKRRAIRQGA